MHCFDIPLCCSIVHGQKVENLVFGLEGSKEEDEERGISGLGQLDGSWNRIRDVTRSSTAQRDFHFMFSYN